MTTRSRLKCGLPAVQQQLTGEADYVGTIMADKVAGLTRAVRDDHGVVSHRERTGEGQEVEVAMFENHGVVHARRTRQRRPVRPSPGAGGVSAHRGRPTGRPYRTSDGHIAALIYTRQNTGNAFINAVAARPWARELYSTLEQARTPD